MGAAAHGGPMQEQSVPEGWTPWYRHIFEQFLKNCGSWEGPMPEQFVKVSHPKGGNHAGAREESEKEGAAKTKRCRLSTTPILRSLMSLRGEEAEEL